MSDEKDQPKESEKLTGTIKKSYEIEAGMLRLGPILDSWDRGQTHSFDEVEFESGGVNPERLVSAIKRYIRDKKQITVNVRRQTFVLLTAEQEAEAAVSDSESASRKQKRALVKSTNATRTGQLSNLNRTRAEHLQRHLVAQIGSHEEHKKQQKALVSAPSPRPLLIK